METGKEQSAGLGQSAETSIFCTNVKKKIRMGRDASFALAAQLKN